MSASLAPVPASPLTARIAAELAAAHTAGDPTRQSALQTLLERGLPTSRDENWKYVNLRPLEKVRFVPLSASGSPRPAISVGDLPAAVGKSRYVYVDGVFD